MSSFGFTHFIMLNPHKAVWSMTGYTDKDGIYRYISNRKDEYGNDVPRRFKFTDAKRQLSIPNSQADVIEFLENSPWCVGSPIEQQPIYKRLEDERDAKIANDATQIFVEAITTVNGLRGSDELIELAPIFSIYGKGKEMIWHKLMEYAKHNPEGFLNSYKDPTKEARALLRKALEDVHIVEKIGTMYKWEGVLIGKNEDDAVSTLMKDKALADSIKSQVELHEAGKSQAETPKKGRPKSK